MASSLATTSRHTLSSLKGTASRALSTTPVRWIEAGVSEATSPGGTGVGVDDVRVVKAGSDDETKVLFNTKRQVSRLREVAMNHFADLGSTQTKATAFRPYKARLDPITARELTISHLLASTAHVGHSLSSIARANVPMLYGTRNGQAIIDVEKYTLPAIKLACRVVKDVVYRDGVVVFLGTAPGTEKAVLAAAKRLGKNGFHVAKERWIPGVISNAPKLLARAILGDMETYEEEVMEKRGSSAKVDASSLATQHLQPDLLIVLNPKNNVHAIREATEQGIATIAITDTDVDPRLVTYAIPANDESIRTAELIVGLLSKAGEEGAAQRKQKEDELDKKRSRQRSNVY
ncbi:hypothetical protein CBS101457_002499 [Exobasidium rhododendri]|nr:hypothetical protein CBS101457_002499 [Exobasidium rhododendri]